MSSTRSDGRSGVETPGDEDEPVTAGENPPPPPENATAIVGRDASDDPADGGCYVVRVSLAEPNEEWAAAFLEELEEEVDVLGTTLDDEVGSETPGRFDVVLTTEYDPVTVVDALARPAEVAAVTAVTTNDDGSEARTDETDAGAAVTGATEASDVPGEADAGATESEVSESIEEVAVGTDEGEAIDDGSAGADAEAGAAADSVGEGADVEAGAAADSVGEGADAADSEGLPGGQTGADAASGQAVLGGERGVDAASADGSLPGEAAGGGSGGAGAPGVGSTTVEEEDRTASPPEFENLKAEVDAVCYENLLEELESTSLPGEFDETADLDSILEEAAEAGADSTGSAAVHGDRQAPDVGDGTATRASATVTPDDVVAALVTAVEEDALTDEQRRAIGEAVDAGPPKTMHVKLDHLQREIDELTAYKESLESFIDEYGDGDELVEQVREAMQAFASDVQRIGVVVQALRDDLVETNDRLDGLGDRIEEVDARADAFDERLERTGRRLRSLDDEFDALTGFESRLGEYESRLADLGELESRVAAVERRERRLDAVESELAELRDRVGEDASAEDESDVGRLDELRERVSTLETDTSAHLNDVVRRLDQIDERLDEQEAWRDRFRSLLTGVSSPGEEPEE